MRHLHYILVVADKTCIGTYLGIKMQVNDLFLHKTSKSFKSHVRLVVERERVFMWHFHLDYFLQFSLCIYAFLLYLHFCEFFITITIPFRGVVSEIGNVPAMPYSTAPECVYK